MTVPGVLSLSGNDCLNVFNGYSQRLSDADSARGSVRGVAGPDDDPLWEWKKDHYRQLWAQFGFLDGSLKSFGETLVNIQAPTSLSAGSREETLQYIDELGHLEDGWDGYEGYSPSLSACGNARSVITCIAAEFPKLPSPEIGPTTNGTLTLAWKAPAGNACIEIGDSLYSAYIRVRDEFVPLKGECSELGERQLQLIWSRLYQ